MRACLDIGDTDTTQFNGTMHSASFQNKLTRAGTPSARGTAETLEDGAKFCCGQIQPTNHPFRKENDLPSLLDYVPAVSVQGCTFQTCGGLVDDLDEQRSIHVG